MIVLKNKDEIKKLHECNKIVLEVLDEVEMRIKSGVSTAELDELATIETIKRGARPAFKGYRGYPKSLCTSINNEVIHGIPSSDRKLIDGDIIGIDYGVFFNGFYGDSARTVKVGNISYIAEKLIDTARRALLTAIDVAIAGNRIGDISSTIQEVVESESFSVVRDFVGHGIGRELHEDPQVPNYGKRGTGIRLKAGMVLAIEPMINVGKSDVFIEKNGWTATTSDGSLSAHYEYSVAIDDNKSVILGR